MNSNTVSYNPSNESFAQALKSLLEDRFNMNDSKRINSLSQQLTKLKLGWVNQNIHLLVNQYNAPSISEDFLYYYMPYCYQYLQQISRPCWFWITIPEGVQATDLFLYQNHDDHYNEWMNLKNSIEKQGIGELMFFKIDPTRIMSVFLVAQPFADNVKKICENLQEWIDNQYIKIYKKHNTDWKVNCSKLIEYNDIPITLRNIEKTI